MRSATMRACIVTLVVSGCSADGTGPAGGPQPGVPVVYPTGGTTLTRLAALDLVGDTRRDLITVARGDGSVRVLPGQSAGAFAKALAFTAGDDPIPATAGDLNGDGLANPLVVRDLSHPLFVRPGPGRGPV